VQVGALEQRRIGQRHRDVVGPAVGILLDAGAGELGEADGEVDVGVGVIGRPAAAAGLTPAAGVDAAAEDEPLAERVGVRVARRDRLYQHLAGLAVSGHRPRSRPRGIVGWAVATSGPAAYEATHHDDEPLSAPQAA
jgi:hypothetical protein